MVAFGGWEGRDLCGRGRSMAGAGDWWCWSRGLRSRRLTAGLDELNWITKGRTSSKIEIDLPTTILVSGILIKFYVATYRR